MKNVSYSDKFFFDSPAVVLVRLRTLILLIMKYTIFQYVGCTLKHQFLKGTVLQVTAVRAENLPSNAKYLLYCSICWYGLVVPNWDLGFQNG